ncbi:MAG: sugar phosphate isomerase/epimerase [Lentisphaeria bacterium]|nr:sugar phosphate isomerase/epimerase [Lentisphaeria bacterium]
MKIGVSSYSLSGAISAGAFDVLGAIDHIASIGGEHMEVVPSANWSFQSEEDPLVQQVKERAAAAGIDLSSYTIGANFLTETEEARQAEIERVKGQVRIAAALGVKFMRHDAGWRPIEQCTVENYYADLPGVVEACQIIADYAKPYGITTSVENHGYHFQGSERVHHLVNMVDRENFRTTLDVGNFLCADENSVAATKNNIGIASFIHFKDMLIRKKLANTAGFFPTRGGNFLRGTITGHGDVDLISVAEIIKASGYDGYISIEFEGPENCIPAVTTSLNYVKALFA